MEAANFLYFFKYCDDFKVVPVDVWFKVFHNF